MITTVMIVAALAVGLGWMVFAGGVIYADRRRDRRERAAAEQTWQAIQQQVAADQEKRRVAREAEAVMNAKASRCRRRYDMPRADRELQTAMHQVVLGHGLLILWPQA